MAPRNAEQDIQSPKFLAMIVAARAVLAEQIFDRGAAEPSSDGVARRHQHVPALRPEQRPDQGPNRHGKAVLFTVGDPLRKIAACEPLQNVFLFAASQLQPARQPAGTSRALGWDTPSTPSSSGSFFSRRSIGHLGFTGTSLWIDLDAAVAATLLTNRTWPDRSNQAIRELRPRFHDAVRRELRTDHII